MTEKAKHNSTAPCVVLVPPGHSLDDRLPEVLVERGWSPRVEQDARLAMAEICLLRRELRVQCAWNESPMEWPGLIVVDPRALAHWEPLLSAMETHVPDISIWGWDGIDLVRIHDGRIEAEEHVAPAPSPASLPFRPEPLSHDEVSMLLHGRGDTETP
ncbi:MAG: hypothetical protein P8L37_04120 [Phycisphaerales bacterium]|nr:hypothetical protein [Phycisphaerales bacterium]